MIPTGVPWDLHGRPMSYPQKEKHSTLMGDPWATYGPSLKLVGYPGLLMATHGLPCDVVVRLTPLNTQLGSMLQRNTDQSR